MIRRFFGSTLKKESFVPQNLITWSEAFNNSSWNKLFGSTINPDSINSPEGSPTADSYTVSTNQFGCVIRRNYNFLNQKYTYSVHLKRNNWDYVGLRISNSVASGDAYPFINLTTLAVNNLGLLNAVVGVESLTDGWVRFWLEYIPPAGISVLDIGVVKSNGRSDQPNNGIDSVYIWGAQLNEGPIRPYSKTQGSIIP